MQIPRNKFSCKFQGTLQLGQKVMIRFWWASRLSSVSRNHLSTFCIPSVHYASKIVFCDSWLYLKQLSLFRLLWLISASTDGIDYITNLYRMIELLHELKNSSF